ncbi:MAG: sodium:solute symporter [Bacteroidota bacterium]|nr:sodium:solute symporter [Bacteroidota bacterium]
MKSIDLIVFVCYLLGTLYLSVIFFSKKRTSKSFTLGSGKTPQWVVTLSIFATFVSSISYLALPGSAYGSNWNAFVFSLSIPIAALITVRYFIPVYRRINSSSAYTYMEQRFGPWAKIYVSICYISTQLMRVGTIIYLLALAINMILGWDMITVIVFTGVFVTVYSIIGGIEAVLWTDAIQGIVLILGAVFCVAILLVDMPEGPVQLFKVAIEDNKFSFGDFDGSINEPTFWVVLIYGIFINLQNFGIDQNYIQRYMVSSSETNAKKSAFYGGMLYLPVSAIFLFIGTALYAYYKVKNGLPEDLVNSPDKVFPHFIVNELPEGVSGLLIASIFAAGMSTISTSFNSTSTVLLTDYFKKNAVENKKLWFLYGSTVVICLISIIIALVMIDVKNILDVWWKYASILSGGMLGLFLLGIFSNVKTNKNAILGLIVGILAILILTLYPVLFPEREPLTHSYLTTVIGTLSIFLTGILMYFLKEIKR